MSTGSGLAFLSVAVAVGLASYFLSTPFDAVAAIIIGIVGFNRVADVIKAIEIRKAGPELR